MRRMATVVNSVPDASSAASITSRLGAPPVPMINLELNSWPAMIRGSASLSASESVAERMSTTLHRRHDLHSRAFCQFRVGVLASGDHLPVHRDCDTPTGCGALWKVEYIA